MLPDFVGHTKHIVHGPLLRLQRIVKSHSVSRCETRYRGCVKNWNILRPFLWIVIMPMRTLLLKRRVHKRPAYGMNVMVEFWGELDG